MLRIGYTLSSEEHAPNTLIKNAALAEEAGFDFVSISDHYHPWVDSQGQSPLVWSVIGGIAQVTKKINVMTGVTCPILRIHPAIIAQAAATSQDMLEGRFILGIGTGELLNEHVIGQSWPPINVRQEMITEATHIIRLLLKGGYQTFWGKFFNLDSARIYTLPKSQVPIFMAASGPESTRIASKIADGFICTSPDSKLTKIFDKTSKKKHRPKIAQFHVCFDKSIEKAKKIMTKVWPNSALPEPLNTELRLPKDFQSSISALSEEQILKGTPLGDNHEAIIQKIKEFQKAGFDQIYIHNVGPNQSEFIQFANRNVLPSFKKKYSILKPITRRKVERGQEYQTPSIYQNRISSVRPKRIIM
jgi:coenzyme F420-dependent glucose-6-phosphate dehydrogenase